MRRWLRPNELPQLAGWDLWRLREVGAWGDAARILGARWEEVGGQALVDRCGDAIVPLWRDRALGRWLGTLGLPNPDAILVEGATLRPIDLKWAIDTATHTQVAAETFHQLVERAGDRLAALLPGAPTTWRLGDGYFATPDRPINRLYLRSRANQEDARAILARDVMWLPVDVPGFYAPLPGWATGRRLASFEGVDDPARDLETADRYFHLGVGVRGALAAGERSAFEERPDASDEALLRVDREVEQRIAARLDALLAATEGGVRDFVRRLGWAQVERRVLRQRLRELERPGYRFGDYMRDVRQARLGMLSDGAARTAAVREIYRDVSRSHAVELRRRGRALVVGGASEPEALEHLGGRDEQARLNDRARDLARTALRALRIKERAGSVGLPAVAAGAEEGQESAMG